MDSRSQIPLWLHRKMKRPRPRPVASGSQGALSYKQLIPIALLISIVGVVYLRLINAEFVNFDDPDYVYENPNVSGGLSWNGVAYAFTTNDMSNWHPVTWLSLMLDAQVYGDWAGGFHLTNVLLNVGGVVAYYFSLLFIFQNRVFAFLAAMLYAVHPLHVESVAWISERKGILSTLFWMLSLLAYSFYVRKPSIHRMLVVVAALTLGLMSKQMLVTLPIALLLLDYWPLNRSKSVFELVKEKWLLFLVCVMFSAIAYVAQKSGGALQSLEFMPLTERCSNAVVAFNAYLVKFIVPAGLYVPRITPRVPHHTWLVVSCLAFSVGLCATAFLSRHRMPHLTVGVFWYLITIVPVIGIIPIGIQWMADRYSDIPLMGVTWAVLWHLTPSLTEVSSFRKFSLAGVLIALTSLAGLSTWQTTVWSNTETLFTNTLHHDPDNDLALLHLGTMYMATSQFSKAENSLRAIVSDEHTSPIVQSMAANNLIHLLTLQGEPVEAVSVLGQLKNFDYATHDSTIVDLVYALQSQGDIDDAYRVLESAVESSPRGASFRLALATILLSEGQAVGARDQLLIATQVDPSIAEGFYNLGLAQVKLGNLQDGVLAYHRAIALDADRPEFFNNLAVAYVGLGDARAAIDNYRRAISLKADYAVAHYNLACILIANDISGDVRVSGDVRHHLEQAIRFAGQNQSLAAAAKDKLASRGATESDSATRNQ
jgi:protein O-mannosyl-transferase